MKQERLDFMHLLPGPRERSKTGGPMIANEMSAGLVPATDRNRWQAIRRGFAMHCPNCGKGAMFCSYLKVNEACPNCGEELFHQRADDAPPYITIMVVGHIIGACMIAVEEWNDTIPIWIHA